jgi:quinol monooxygenase YgiN
MEGHVSWVIELAVKDVGAFTALRDEMIEGTRPEAETLGYEWYRSADERTVHIYEKYSSSETMIAHVNGFLEKWAGRFLEYSDVTRFVVYGDPSPEARAILDGFHAVYLGPWGGFSRFTAG